MHKQLNGKVFSYDNPPVIDERTGQRGLPGETYNCRCTQIPTSLTVSALARNSNDDDIDWITVKGNHIPIKKGQTKEDAVKEFLEKKGKQSKTKDKAPTIAGVKKGKPMNFKQANKGRVNPNYSTYSYKYSMNCQTCVAVFEARLRGYDVEAQGFSMHEKDKLKLAQKPYIAYIDPKTGLNPTFISTKTNNATECEKWLKNNIKRGERYAFGYAWTDKSKHIIIVYKTLMGNIEFYDPQNGHKYNLKLLNYILYNSETDGKVRNVSPQIFRTDDKEINIEILNKVSKPIHK